MYPEFTYQEMRKRRAYSSEEAGYSYTPGPRGFITMYARDPNNFRNIHLETGWKFHISLDQDQEHNGANLAAGWDIVNKVLREHHCPEWKIIMQAEANVGVGKQITIFAYKDDKTASDWQSILQEIENGLINANINPDRAGFTEKDKNIPGSQYISYRNDSDPRGQYLPEKRAISYNDSGQTDPYTTLSFTPPEKGNKRNFTI